MVYPYQMKQGCDLVAIERFLGALREKNTALLTKFLTENERKHLETYYRFNFIALEQIKNPLPLARSLAARFAAKEAFLKALGTGLSQGFSFQDIEIQGGLGQAPCFVFYGKVRSYLDEKALCDCSLSLSHDGQYALATCLLVFEKRKEESNVYKNLNDDW